MTKDQAKVLAPIMLAWANGAKIQYKGKSSNIWFNDNSKGFAFDPAYEYRIKPEPKTVPLTIEDLYEHFKKGTIFSSSKVPFKSIIVALTKKTIYMGHGNNYSIDDFHLVYTFEDGSPLTKVIEE